MVHSPPLPPGHPIYPVRDMRDCEVGWLSFYLVRQGLEDRDDFMTDVSVCVYI